jgi:hypothetical protein
MPYQPPPISSLGPKGPVDPVLIPENLRWLNPKATFNFKNTNTKIISTY